MRARLGGILTYLILGVSLLCFGAGVISIGQAGSRDEYLDATLREPLTGDSVKSVLDGEEQADEAYSVVFWREQQADRIEWKGFGRSSSGAVLHTAGQSGLLAAGGILPEESADACLVSEALARELFGTVNPGEAAITIGAKEYQVKGVVAGEQKFVIAPGDDQGFNRMRVRIPEGKRKEQVGELLASRYGFTAEPLSYYLVRGFSWIVVCLTPLAIFLHFVGWSIRSGKQQQRLGNKLIFYGAALLALVWGIWLVAANIEIPLDMVPTKWSDFSFWEQMLENKNKELQLLLQTGKTIIDQPLLSGCYRGIVLGVISLGLYFLWIICYTMRRIRRDGGRQIDESAQADMDRSTDPDFDRMSAEE